MSKMNTAEDRMSRAYLTVAVVVIIAAVAGVILVGYVAWGIASWSGLI